MSDRMRPIPFERLLPWVLGEYRTQGTIFGVHKLFHKEDGKTLSLFGETMETPFGPAAGPHTQLAQNIIAAYAAGSRFFELKTVQTLDGEDLPVAKPCIDARDECYNVEWSTELRVSEAFEEYVKAWFVLKLLARECGFGSADGFIFNMSVGYDLAGIQSPKIDAFIEGLKDAENTGIWKTCKEYALSHLELFQKADAAYIEGISPRVCRSITLSTLHGCPPQEIERIAAYLIEEKCLHTYVKCNPTLLGYEFARQVADSLGFGYLVFDSRHFKADLQFGDAVPMLERLMKLAEGKGLAFGVKLTNTFPVGITRGELPGEEMYLSGRALFPLTVSLAQRLSGAFSGKLRISYSGGADALNVADVFEAGIWPITMAATVLKPGGYNRMHQTVQVLEACEYRPFGGVDLEKLGALARDAMQNPHYRKPDKALPERKSQWKVPLADCFTAPCRGGCPIEQDIPAYLRLAGEGRHKEAFRVILEKNPLPFITGTICSHHCMEKCTRNFYDEAVHIREVKLETAQKAYQDYLETFVPPRKEPFGKVAVVGGGPAGLAAAYFLAKEGRPVTLFEKSDVPGGVVRRVIPGFRIPQEAIEKDIALVRAMGVELVMNAEKTSVAELRKAGFEYVVLATGAWKPGSLRMQYGEPLPVLEFLERCKSAPETLKLGRNVAVVGGGNTAMDAARAATRMPGVERVSLVYRRTKQFMPADEEELALAVEDGVVFCELLAPVGIKGGKLVCHGVVLGEPDASGRRTPVETEDIVEIPADTVIAAVGERVDSALYTENGIKVDERGFALVREDSLETSLAKVYVAGDGRRGPSTVVEAIADAAKCAADITRSYHFRYEDLNRQGDPAMAFARKGLLGTAAGETQCTRCLECATICENCVDVCPNRANIAITVKDRKMPQIIHVDGMCNECGNCAAFCPYDSAPYKDKFTLFGTQADFGDSANQGFLLLSKEEKKVRVRLDSRVFDVVLGKDSTLPKELEEIALAVIQNNDYLFYQSAL